MDPHQAAKALKTYKSHRRIPDSWAVSRTWFTQSPRRVSAGLWIPAWCRSFVVCGRCIYPTGNHIMYHVCIS